MIVSTGNRTLIDTCSVVANEEPIRIELTPTIVLQFEFENTEDEKQKLNLNVIENVLVVRLQNFNNPLGTASATPIEIGTYQNERLFIHFSVNAIGDKTKLLTCSFWKGGRDE